jgi:hypothetical protein
MATLTVTVAMTLAACGGGSSSGSSSSPTASPAAAKAAVAHTYETFFSSPIPVAKTLLEDGASLSAAFAIANRLKGNAKESAKVHSVTLTSPTTADVKYELDTDGNPVLPNADGKAVYVNGHWLVAKATFCQLVGLAQPGKPVKGCT